MEGKKEADSDDSGFEEQPETQVRLSCETPAEGKSAQEQKYDPSVQKEAMRALPPLTVQPLTGYGSSLLPDMLFGWRPKLVHGGPIPLLFNRAELPVSRNHLTDEENFIVFHGFRPKDSLVMHNEFSGPETYPVPNYPTMQVYEFLHRKDPKMKDFRPFVGTNPDCSPSDLEFNSTFESGNLDMAVKVRDQEYDLYMRADANTRGHHQWYYFSVVSPTATDVRFNILNFTKNESLYSQGMLPFVYNEAHPERGWHRSGTSVKYRTSKLNPFTRRNYYCLAFNYTFENTQKRVFFAYAIPYTYTRLFKLLRELSLQSEFMLKREHLCKSLSGVEVPLLTITNFSIPNKHKQSVVVTGRVHPGETHGSFMMEVSITQGFLRFLLSDSPTAQTLRNRLIFHVVPMLNPDGVLMGNYRTGFAGCDLNRQFQSPDFVLHPTVTALKTLITKVWKESDLLAFLDLHAHSKQKCVFLYGPHYPLHSEKYYKMRVLPKLICARSALFRYSSCKFKNERSKRKAARLVIWKEFKLANSYTVEASFYGYLTPERTTIPFDEDLVLKAGVAIAEGLHEYLELQDQETQEREMRRRKRKTRKKKVSADIPKSENPQDSPATLPDIPSVPENQTLEDVIECIKEDETTVVPSLEQSDSSDGDPSEDDLEAEDQKQLHEQIVAVMEEFSALSTHPKTVRPVAKVRSYIEGKTR